jgi:hypothetical protein
MGFLDGIFDKEKLVRETIQACLQEVGIELGCTHKELFIMIKPTDEQLNDEFDFKCWIYKIETAPKLIREISLKEILGDDDE